MMYFCTELKRARRRWTAYEAYRVGQGTGLTPEQVSEVLLAVAPHVSAFVGRLFGVEKELAGLAAEVKDRSPLWRFKQDFAKKRVLKPTPARPGRERSRRRGPWPSRPSPRCPRRTRRPSCASGTHHLPDEEVSVAKAVVLLAEVDDVARKAAKAGGAEWSEELRGRAAAVRPRSRSDWKASKVSEEACAVAGAAATDAENQRVVAFALDAIEAWLAHRKRDHGDPAHRWPSLHVPRLDYQHLVELRRPDPKLPELFVGPEHERRERDGFALTDRRGGPAHGRAGDRLLPLLPRPRQGLLLQGPARQQDAARSRRTRSASPLDGLPARREDQRDAR